jgi:hypothetical protein
VGLNFGDTGANGSLEFNGENIKVPSAKLHNYTLNKFLQETTSTLTKKLRIGYITTLKGYLLGSPFL